MALTGACHILVSSGNSFVFVKAITDGGSLSLGVEERDLDTSDKADKEAVQWEIIASAGGYLIKNKMRSSYVVWKRKAKEFDKVELSTSSATALWRILPEDYLKTSHRIVPVMKDVAQEQLRWGVYNFKLGTPVVLSGKNYAFRIREFAQKPLEPSDGFFGPFTGQICVILCHPMRTPKKPSDGCNGFLRKLSIKPIRMAQLLEVSVTDRAGRSSSDLEGRQAVTTSITVVPKPPGVTRRIEHPREGCSVLSRTFGDRPTFTEDLAMSLLKLGFDFIKAPRHDDAVLTHKESIGLFKNLAKPDGSLQARALQSLAASFRAAGFDEDASRAHEEGAAMFHELAKTHPAHIPDTLHCLVADFRDFGFREDAARTEEEAIKLYCELAATTTGANSPIECLELLAKGEGSAPEHVSGVA
ncbi:hypothetical protein K438DRAFT_1780797 [Mycena galopus ATCC 62051]|nr:hypothetical protein K438DRAFT_1780797 [Mycena galopus ATCC 62051]